MPDQLSLMPIGHCTSCVKTTDECEKPKMRDIAPWRGCDKWSDGAVRDDVEAEEIDVSRDWFDRFPDPNHYITVNLKILHKYECVCGHKFEIKQEWDEAVLKHCPACQQGTLTEMEKMG